MKTNRHTTLAGTRGDQYQTLPATPRAPPLPRRACTLANVRIDAISLSLSVSIEPDRILWLSCVRLAQSPFPFLYRDSDVEGMTDGWDDVTAYGWEWASASTSWPAPVATQRHMRLSARNSGLFSLRATQVGVPSSPVSLWNPSRVAFRLPADPGAS
jgi:hypothetical protein